MAVLSKTQALEASTNGVVVDMKELAGVNENVERVDIDVLLTDHPKTFNLMLLALADMMNAKADSVTGWFQVAGIHGRPSTVLNKEGEFVPQTWDGVDKGLDTMRWGGYCAHGVLTFAPWHRPYLALLEQSLYRRMEEIAILYTDPTVKSDYLKELKHFRLPYFDYFRPRGPSFSTTALKDINAANLQFAYDFKLPEIFNRDKVFVWNHPDNARDYIDNPLYAYKFGEKPGLSTFNAQDLKALVGNYKCCLTGAHIPCANLIYRHRRLTRPSQRFDAPGQQPRSTVLTCFAIASTTASMVSSHCCSTCSMTLYT
jgi:hypothetical protein